MIPNIDTKWISFAEVYNDIKTYPALSDVAAKLGLTYRTTRSQATMLRKMHERGDNVPPIIARIKGQAGIMPVGNEHRSIVTELESYEEPISELMDRVFKTNEKFAVYNDNKSIIDVDLKINGPYGVVGLPDHHLNNIGTMARRAFDDAYIIANHPALYCVGIGDWLDNFVVGFLERERRKDIMSHGDSWRLLEHYFSILAPKMIAGISGNHMDWTTSAGGVDVMRRMFEDQGLGAIYDPDQVRVRLRSPNGATSTHIARHKYRGNSRFNSAHAITVWILENWQGEDVVWGGHIHQAAHCSIEKQWMGQKKVVHGVQLGAYKAIDGYAKREAFRQNVPFLTPMTIHVPDTGETLFFDDIVRGVQVLNMLRAEHHAGTFRAAA